MTRKKRVTNSPSVNILDLWNLKSMIYRRLEGKGIGVRFKEGIKTACTARNEIIFPEPSLPMTQEQLDLYYGYMIHECGHHSRPRVFQILDNVKLPEQHPMGGLFNMIEDNCMEREVSKNFIGDQIALSKGMKLHVDRQIEHFRKKAPPELLDHPEQQKIQAVYMLGLLARQQWDHNTLQNVLNYKNTMKEPAIDLFKELDSEGWVEKLQAPVTTDEAWDTACDLFKRLYNITDDECERLKEKGKGDPNDGEEEEDEKGKSQGKDGKDDEEGEGQSEEGKDGKEGEDINKLPDFYGTYSWDQLVHSDHPKMEGFPMVIDWSSHKFEHSNIKLLPPDKIKVYTPTVKSPPYVRQDDSAAALANSIRIYIQATSRTKFTPEQYSGKIDKRSIVRLGFPPIEGGDWNRRVFYQETKKRYKNTCIGILTDWSGSMNGKKKITAATATSRLAKVFDQQLRCPTFIATFSSGYEDCTIGIIKDWNDKAIYPEKIGGMFKWFDRHTAGNADADAVAWMFRQMKSRKEERKILLVLSDGAPTDGAEGACPDTTLKHVVTAIQNTPKFDIIGIGIHSNQVRRYYDNYKVINNTDQLDIALLEVLKEVYVNGN